MHVNSSPHHSACPEALPNARTPRGAPFCKGGGTTAQRPARRTARQCNSDCNADADPSTCAYACTPRPATQWLPACSAISRHSTHTLDHPYSAINAAPLPAQRAAALMMVMVMVMVRVMGLQQSKARAPQAPAVTLRARCSRIVVCAPSSPIGAGGACPAKPCAATPKEGSLIGRSSGAPAAEGCLWRIPMRCRGPIRPTIAAPHAVYGCAPPSTVHATIRHTARQEAGLA